ncbi:MAG TPA: homoserine kinase [Vicinamibacterales bacterium]|jgi:homoserine kinase|nr:homoserine kinase [Vicinamibacterales bacterium]
MSPPDRAVAFAPASVGNVGVGFDVLGYSAAFAGDRVTAERTASRGVRIAAIRGVVTDLPLDAERNTAGMAVTAMAEALGLDFGFALTIEKGIPLGSGLGGSAASAVAAVVAANALLEAPVDNLRLLKFAMRGEEVASGTAHIDNIAPSLYGGLVLSVGIDHPHIKQIPVPSNIRSVLVRPHRVLETRDARAMLDRTVTLSDVIWQQANLAGVVAGCFTSDLALIAASLEDVLIEPQRKRLIPGFQDVKDAAMAHGALGCSISGAGPAMFAWVEEGRAEEVRASMVESFRVQGISSDAWVTRIEAVGARVER